MAASAVQARPQLWREKLESPILSPPLRSGWINGNRLASLANQNVFFAAEGHNVIEIKAVWSSKRQRLDSSASEALDTSEDFIAPNGIGLSVHSRVIPELSTLRSDIVTVAAQPGRLACSDSFGNVVVGLLESSSDSSQVKTQSSYALRPSRFEYGEPGYSGIALDKRTGSASMIACARYFFKDVSTYDGDISVRTFHTGAGPTAISFVDDQRLAIAEGYGFGLWDLRMAEAGGCTVRKPVGPGRIYSMHSLDHLLAVGGTDRVVRVFDVRMHRILGQWSNSLKYACRWVSLHSDQKTCFVAGVDNEIAAGTWGEAHRNSSKKMGAAAELRGQPKAPQMVSGALARSPRRLYGFRGDSPWIGVSLSMETLAAMSSNGAFYVLKIS